MVEGVVDEEDEAPSKAVWAEDRVSRCAWDKAEDWRGELEEEEEWKEDWWEEEAPLWFDLEKDFPKDFPTIIDNKCLAESPYEVSIVEVAKTPPGRWKDDAAGVDV